MSRHCTRLGALALQLPQLSSVNLSSPNYPILLHVPCHNRLLRSISPHQPHMPTTISVRLTIDENTRTLPTFARVRCALAVLHPSLPASRSRCPLHVRSLASLSRPQLSLHTRNRSPRIRLRPAALRAGALSAAARPAASPWARNTPLI